MGFKVYLHPGAAKALRKLGDDDRESIKQALLGLEVDPFKAGKQLHPSDFRSLRSGDYRAIYEINGKAGRVVVLFVGHRKKVYDDFSKLL